MSIVYASDGLRHESRAYVAAYLDKKLEENADYCIVDIGGGANPWYPHTKYIVDIVSYENTERERERENINGDLHDSSLWDKVRAVHPDFIICTHVLEDIRDPFFVIDEICRSAPAGYISMPTKHQEFSRQESLFYVGHCHHRWIYTLDDNVLKAIAKMPIVNYWAPIFTFFRKLCTISLLRQKLDILGYFWPAMPDLPWLDTKKGRESRELGFIFEGGFDWQYINGDFAGTSYKELANLYMHELKSGL